MCLVLAVSRFLGTFSHSLPYPTEKLVTTWKEVGLQLKTRSPAACKLCQQPLYLEEMTEKEKSYFSGHTLLISAMG